MQLDCARRFAGALGLLVKTALVDAEVLARNGRFACRAWRRSVDLCSSMGRLALELTSKAALCHSGLQRQAAHHRSAKCITGQVVGWRAAAKREEEHGQPVPAVRR